MVTTGALLFGDVASHLQFNEEEHPVALQLGGAEPEELAKCARLAEDWGYDEVNLNCGCPSDRVQNGRFGACLMLEPERVRDCVSAMMNACSIPVTIKQRIGIDDQEDYSLFRDFVGTVASGGCSVFIVHARNAWLQGLSPKENRDIPPLKYDWVMRLKREFPALTIVLNGGISSLEECTDHLKHLDGVMLGRAAYQSPWLLSHVDSTLFDCPDPLISRAEAVEAMIPYIEKHLAGDGKLHHVTRHLLGLYSRQPGGRQFRRALSENAHKDNATVQTLLQAVELCANSKQAETAVYT
jgi:tRNA-dihydrouridine synthase A